MAEWEELLRKMLPQGAPLPDEEHLDYSISFDYRGPSLPLSHCKVSPVPTAKTRFSAFTKQPSPFFTNKRPAWKSSSDCKRPVDNIDEFENVVVTEDGKKPVDSFVEIGGDVVIDGRVLFNSLSDFDDVSVDGNGGKGDDHEVEESDQNRSNEFLCYDEGRDERMNEFIGGENRGVGCENGSKEEKKKIGIVIVRKKRSSCTRCGRQGSSFLRLMEMCIVCGSGYCKKCVLKAMGSMPEGRKCVGCIGKPINEARRGKLGKSSRLLSRVCSRMEVEQIMKAERECAANQLRPEQIVVNRKQLREEELAELLESLVPPRDLRPGRYWYDKDSGLWGKEGEKPSMIISSKLNVGGKLQTDASSGNTRVYMNSREITKVELKVLKLAKVHCPCDTRFWLYEDGSYEEEGQNIIKGNIWQKASTRLLSSICSLPIPSAKPTDAKKKCIALSARYLPKYLEQHSVQKLLLLGLEGSGTSTIFKQVKFSYTNKFDAEELHKIKLIIQSNVFRYLCILLEGREQFEEEALMKKGTFCSDSDTSMPGHIQPDAIRDCIYSISQRMRHFSKWLLDIMANGYVDTLLTAAVHEYAPVMDEIWKDPAIQETYRRMEELHLLPDVTKYFLEKVIEISSNEYEPSEKDILYAEGLTPCNGLASVEFSLDDQSRLPATVHEYYQHQPPPTKYQLLRLSLKCRHESCKWLDMFEDVRAVIFCISLTDYDVMVTNGSSQQNKILASRDFFETVVRHACFRDASFLLLLNKYDLFEDKISRVPLTVCEWFHDFNPLWTHHGRPSLANQAYYYVAIKFKELYTSLTGQKLYVWQTRAREQASVDEVFKYVREILRWEDERDANLYAISGDDSSSSAEFTDSITLTRKLR